MNLPSLEYRNFAITEYSSGTINTMKAFIVLIVPLEYSVMAKLRYSRDGKFKIVKINNVIKINLFFLLIK